MCRRKLTNQVQVSNPDLWECCTPKGGVFPGIDSLKINPSPEGVEASYSVSVAILEAPL